MPITEHSTHPATESFTERTGFRFAPALALMVGYWCALVLLDTASDGFNIYFNYWNTPPSVLWEWRSIWFGSWMVVTPLVLILLGWAYPGRFGWKRTVAAHALGHPLIIAVQVLIATTVLLAFDPSSRVTVIDHAIRLFLTVSLGRDLHAYAALVGIFYALSLRKRRFLAELRAAKLTAESAELSRRLTEAKLESLRRELEPHLLFNALNSIGTLVRTGERTKAVRMLASMSTLLRAYLEPSPEPFVPLQEELDLLDRYLDMERVRLEDRFQVRITVDPSALDCRVPRFLLQPIVENAIKHGADRTHGATLLQVDVETSPDQILIRVVNESNPRPALEVSVDQEREGIGLSNIRRRLDLLFGAHAGLELAHRPGGACVTAWMPHADHRSSVEAVDAPRFEVG